MDCRTVLIVCCHVVFVFVIESHATVTNSTDHKIYCRSEPFTLECNHGYLATADIYGGTHGNESINHCGYFPNDCLGAPSMFLQPMQICLWKDHSCSFTEKPVFPIFGVRGCTEVGELDYVKVENFQCIPEEKVHRLCAVTAVSIEEEGYVLTPEFPSPYGPDKSCFVTIYTTSGQGLHIATLHPLHMDSPQNGDLSRADGINITSKFILMAHSQGKSQTTLTYYGDDTMDVTVLGDTVEIAMWSSSSSTTWEGGVMYIQSINITEDMFPSETTRSDLHSPDTTEQSVSIGTKDSVAMYSTIILITTFTICLLSEA